MELDSMRDLPEPVNRWQEIWQKRTLDPQANSTFARLLALDGFDRLGKVDEQAMRDYIDRVAVALNIAPDDAVYDVGCGAGAFLYPFYERGGRVGGLDYAANLIRFATEAMPGADIRAAEAIAVDPAEHYEVVVSSGAFLYFPSYDYARETLLRMALKALKAVAVLDVPDLAQRDLAQALREGKMGREEYRRLYTGLEHLYFPRDWFAATLADIPCAVRVEDQNIKGYLHNSYRYNVFIELREGVA